MVRSLNSTFSSKSYFDDDGLDTEPTQQFMAVRAFFSGRCGNLDSFYSLTPGRSYRITIPEAWASITTVYATVCDFMHADTNYRNGIP